MRCGSKIAFVMFIEEEPRLMMVCSLERGHEGKHKFEGLTEVYTEDWEDGKYIETMKEEYLGLRNYILEWENKDNSSGTMESKITYWKTIGGKNMSEFKKGDVVQLTSGGPKMTIEEVGNKYNDTDYTVDCVWFDGAEVYRDTFRKEILMIRI